MTSTRQVRAFDRSLKCPLCGKRFMSDSCPHDYGTAKAAFEQREFARVQSVARRRGGKQRENSND